MLAQGSMTVRRIGMGLFLGLATLLLVACDGGPNFAAAVNYVNECPEDVRVSVARSQVAPPDMRPSSADEIPAFSTEVVINEILLPLPETVYLFVADESAERFENSTEFTLADLDKTVAEDGTQVFTIVVSGEMCPAS